MRRLSDAQQSRSNAATGRRSRDGETRQFLVFRLGDEEFGLPIEAVEEVARVPDTDLARPQDPEIPGRCGQSARRGPAGGGPAQAFRHACPEHEDGVAPAGGGAHAARICAGLIVDSVSEVLRASDDDIDAAPDLTGESAKLVPAWSIWRTPGRIILLLDPAELLTPRGTRPSRQVRQAAGQPRTVRRVIKVLVVDDSALMRKVLGQIFGARARNSKSRSRPTAWKRWTQLSDLRARCHHPGRPHAADGWPGVPGPRSWSSGPCPVVMVSSLTAADADATLEAFRLGRGGFRRQTRRRGVALYGRAGPGTADRKVRAAAGAKLKSSLRLKDRVRHRIGGTVSPVPAEPRLCKASCARAWATALVLVGTSTGGPPALEALLTGLPAGFAWPILIAQHMPATFTGSSGPAAGRALRPDRDGGPRADAAEAGLRLYRRGGARHRGRPQDRRPSGGARRARADYPWHPSADRLVRSAMEHVPASQLVGVLMTGMGNDGAEAMTLLHSQGGRTIAEAEESAVVWGMPGELVQAGGADWIVPLARDRGSPSEVDTIHAADPQRRPPRRPPPPRPDDQRGALASADTETTLGAARATVAGTPASAAALGEALAVESDPRVREAHVHRLAPIRRRTAGGGHPAPYPLPMTPRSAPAPWTP